MLFVAFAHLLCLIMEQFTNPRVGGSWFLTFLDYMSGVPGQYTECLNLGLVGLQREIPREISTFCYIKITEKYGPGLVLQLQLLTS